MTQPKGLDMNDKLEKRLPRVYGDWPSQPPAPTEEEWQTAEHLWQTAEHLFPSVIGDEVIVKDERGTFWAHLSAANRELSFALNRAEKAEAELAALKAIGKEAAK